MPHVPKKGSSKPWMAKRKTFAGNKGEDADFYNSRAWRKLRAYIIMGEPLCRECSAPATVVDHIKPIRLGVSKEEAHAIAALPETLAELEALKAERDELKAFAESIANAGFPRTGKHAQIWVDEAQELLKDK